MLFGGTDSGDLRTREGKEKLRADVLAELQKILTDETGEPGVEQVFFTSFVMQ
jgi:flagellar FliL protein